MRSFIARLLEGESLYEIYLSVFSFAFLIWIKVEATRHFFIVARPGVLFARLVVIAKLR
jgi:hypothetical protein